MSDILGGIFGAGTDIAGGYAGAQQALTGFNYLKNNPAEQGYIANGGAANSAQAALLGLGGDSAAQQAAFGKYLNSTGYKFQLGQGQSAVNGGAASRGLLNSGGTAKALTAYGQGLGSQYFNNYMNQLGGVANAGQTALGQVGQAGTQGGIAGGEDIAGGYNNASNSMAGLGSSLGGLLGFFL